MLEKPITIKKSRKPLYISIAIIAAIVISYFLLPGVQMWFDEAWQVLTSDDELRIQNWVADFGWFGPILIVIAMVVQMFLIVIPSWLLMLVSILAYGPVWGSLIALTGIFVASTVGYLIGRYFGPAVVSKLLGKKAKAKVSDFLEHYGIWAIIITRLNPLLSNDAISFMAGLLKMNYWKFISATMIGITPLVLYLAILGELTSGFKTGLIWGSVVSLILFIVYVWWDRNSRKRRKHKR